MSELGELFGAMREASKDKREQNTDKSTQLLVDRGVNFDSNNYGRHLVIRDSGLIIDFWPSTGKWTVRESGKYRRGVFNLLKLIKSRAGE